MEFNEKQLEAINFKDGACSIIAGAGSGKSTVLVNRMKKMVEGGVKEKDLLAISFTNNSASDLKKKLEKVGLSNVTVGTFHKICGRILTLEGINIDRQLALYEIENVFHKIDKKPLTKEIMSWIGYNKSYMCGVDDKFKLKESEHYTESELREFYKAYEKYKKNQEALDFDDWLLIANEILEKKPKKYTCKYILIDEQQDNNLIQNEIMKKLCPSGNIMVIGDFRQCLYGFRGSSPELFMDFDKQFPNAKIINLDYNYRSKKNIVDNANKFMKYFYGDYRYYSDSIANDKELGDIKIIENITKEQEANDIIDLVKKDLASGVDPKDIAILYRLNQNSFHIENALKTEGIDYHIESNNNFFNRKEINVIVCMLRLIQNKDDNLAYNEIYKARVNPFDFMSNSMLYTISDYADLHNISLLEASKEVQVEKAWQRNKLDTFIRILNNLTTQHRMGSDLRTIVNGIIHSLDIEGYITGKYEEGEEMEERLESIEALKSFIRSNTLDSFLKFVYTSSKKKKKNKDSKVQLMTVHKSKGLEFRNVYLVGIEEGKFPSKRGNLIEEARIFYVGITRPKENLIISHLGNSSFVEIYKGNNKIKSKN